MKKTIKIVGISLGVAVLLFLSLPFFMGNKPVNQKPGESAQQATPQIFTSNPLTELVNRIASVFTKKGSAHPGANAAQNTNEQALAGNEELLADARGAAGSPLTEETPQAGGGEGGGLLFGDYEDEWVLAPQVAPEGTSRGMHEISAKGDAYDNYVRAERAARFTPVAINPQTKRVPDSKLARIFNPIKQFFGFDDPYSLEDTDWTDEEAARLAYAQGERESAKNPRQFKRAGMPDMNMPNISYDGDNGTNKEENALSQSEADAMLGKIYSLLSPESSFERFASNIADAKYPAPRTPEQQEKWNKMRTEELEKMKEQAKNKQKLMAQELAAKEKEDVSLLGAVRCVSNTSLKGGCINGVEPPPTPTDEEIKKSKRDLAKKYPQGQEGPNIPVTVIFGKETKPEELSQILQGTLGSVDTAIAKDSTEAKEGTAMAGLYEYMLQKSDCQNNPCFWVATQQQPDDLLQTSVEMAGKVTFKGDPLNLYPQVKEEYLRDLPKDMEGLRQEIENLSTAYVLYTQEDIHQWKTQQKENLANHNYSELSLPYTASANDGKTLLDMEFPTIIGTQTVAVSLVNTPKKPEKREEDNQREKDNQRRRKKIPTVISYEQRATHIAEDITQNFAIYQEVVDEMRDYASKKAINIGLSTSLERRSDESHPLNDYKKEMDTMTQDREKLGTHNR